MKFRPRWPLDTATTLSLFAILLSLIQFLLNTPLLIGFYMKPELTIRGSGSSPTAETLGGTFQIRNEGRGSATNGQIGFTLQEHQRISLMPNVGSRIIIDEKPAFIKNARIEIPKINPMEELIIIVVPGPKGEKLHPEVAKFFMESGIREIPWVSFVKSDEGPGKNLTAAVDRALVSKNLTDRSTGAQVPGAR